MTKPIKLCLFKIWPKALQSTRDGQTHVGFILISLRTGIAPFFRYFKTCAVVHMVLSCILQNCACPKGGRNWNLPNGEPKN